MKHHYLAAVLIAALTLGACSGSRSDEDLGPTATIATSPTATLATSAPDGTDPTDSAHPTSPATIAYDDSAAAEFWEPLPEGMDPAEFQPDYLTREELTKYQPLPDPDPAAWDIPSEGITPEYVERVVLYNWTLSAAMLDYSDQPRSDLERAFNSTDTIYTTGAADSLKEEMESITQTVESESTGRARVTDFAVLEIHPALVTSSDFPCFSALLTDKETNAEGSVTIRRWVGFVRDAEPNWLNPSGWRLYAGSADTDVGEAYVDCKAAESRG